MAAPDAVPPILHLVGHPLRWRLAVALARSDLRVGELTVEACEPQNLVSYHLRLLRDGGLVTSTRSSNDARDRYYHLDLDACAEALAGVGTAMHPALRTTASTVRPDGQADRPSVLFVCTGNSARSPIAEAMLLHRAGRRVRVRSGGTQPRPAFHPHAVRVLREEYGIDVAAQEPRPLDLGTGGRYEHVVTLCDKAREAVTGAGSATRTHWSIPDPAVGSGSGRTGYRRFVATAADIDTRVRHLMPTLGIAS